MMDHHLMADSTTSKMTLLDKVTLFQDLSPNQRYLLDPLFINCYFPLGSTIFAHDASAEYLYLVVSGEVLIRYKPYDGPELTVSHVKPGGVFGWSSAVGSAKYTSSAVSITNSQCLRIRGEDLQNICKQNPDLGTLIMDALARAISERLNRKHAQVIALLEYGLCNFSENGSVENGT